MSSHRTILHPSQTRIRTRRVELDLDPAVAVRPDGPALGVFALRTIGPGELVLTFTGPIVATPNRYSLQIGESRHITPHDPDNLVASVWPFLNHACTPNCIVDDTRLVAAREIAPGERVTFNYNTTELDIAEPFACECGACDRTLIRGFIHLSREEQLELLPMLPAYLRERAGASPET